MDHYGYGPNLFAGDNDSLLRYKTCGLQGEYEYVWNAMLATFYFFINWKVYLILLKVFGKWLFSSL